MEHISAIGARNGASTSPDLSDGLMTLAALVLTFMAFDDITTDHSASFRVEYTGLFACAVWGAVLIVRLVRRGRIPLASACTTLLLALLWGQQSIGPGTRAIWPGHAVASAAFLGFLMVAIYLVVAGTRSARRLPTTLGSDRES
jgi:hypothetical protein